MRKNSKRVLKFVLAFVLIFSMSTTVFAAGLDEAGKIVDGSVLTTEKSSEVTLKTLTKGNILDQGTAAISDIGGGKVNVYGAVFGAVVCDKLILKMTLQRYSDGYWYNVQNFSDTAYNKSLLTKSYNVSVASGYYYRVKAACVAQKGSTSESKDPTTNGLWM